MGRIPFHVSPHFDPASPLAMNEIGELQRLADLSGRSVLILQDGAGIVMQDDDVIFSVGLSSWLSATVDKRLAVALQEDSIERVILDHQSMAG